MMNQQPDKLFRDKLEGYQKQAPASAWDRIDAGLAKKDKPVMWYRVAAAVLLLAVAAFLLWPRGAADTSPQMISKKNKADVQKPEVTDDNKEEQKETETVQPVAPVVTDKKENDDLSPVKNNSQQRKKLKSRPALQPEQKIEQLNEEPTLAATDQNKNKSETAVINNNMTESSVVASAQPVEKTSVTLIITADEANDKYLNKETLAEATSEKKKSSTFKKLLEKAQDLKNNSDPFGDLRQKKNEILALNFKNDKRGQNK